MGKMGKVTLGMPGPWAEDDHEAADHYTTKVGGVPDWPTLDINPDLLKCGLCGGRLYLVAQVYAPISSGNVEVEERTLYVLGCPMLKCASSSDGWRILRVQKCRNGHQSSASHREEKLPAERSNSTSSVNNLWIRDTWIQGSGEQSDGGDDDMNLQELSRAISEAASLASSAKKQNEPMCSAVVAKDFELKPKLNDSSVAVLPCFYIYNEEERSIDNPINIQNQYGSLSIKDDQNLPADSADDDKWEAESYEYDKSLGADRTYLKFKKRMEAYPEQCIRLKMQTSFDVIRFSTPCVQLPVEGDKGPATWMMGNYVIMVNFFCLPKEFGEIMVRYSFGGKPLLATNDVGEPGSCGLCGARRHFEMQLMPPLLYFLQQAANGQSTYSPEDWSWLTLIIYTCSKNCFHQSCEGKSGDSCWEVSEESIVVQCE